MKNNYRSGVSDSGYSEGDSFLEEESSYSSDEKPRKQTPGRAAQPISSPPTAQVIQPPLTAYAQAHATPVQHVPLNHDLSHHHSMMHMPPTQRHAPQHAPMQRYQSFPEYRQPRPPPGYYPHVPVHSSPHHQRYAPPHHSAVHQYAQQHMSYINQNYFEGQQRAFDSVNHFVNREIGLFGGPRMSAEEESLQVAILVSRQDELYGINMIESVEDSDGDFIAQLRASGVSQNEALRVNFTRKNLPFIKKETYPPNKKTDAEFADELALRKAMKISPRKTKAEIADELALVAAIQASLEDADAGNSNLLRSYDEAEGSVVLSSRASFSTISVAEGAENGATTQQQYQYQQHNKGNRGDTRYPKLHIQANAPTPTAINSTPSSPAAWTPGDVFGGGEPGVQTEELPTTPYADDANRDLYYNEKTSLQGPGQGQNHGQGQLQLEKERVTSWDSVTDPNANENNLHSASGNFSNNNSPYKNSATSSPYGNSVKTLTRIKRDGSQKYRQKSKQTPKQQQQKPTEMGIANNSNNENDGSDYTKLVDSVTEKLNRINANGSSARLNHNHRNSDGSSDGNSIAAESSDYDEEKADEPPSWTTIQKSMLPPPPSYEEAIGSYNPAGVTGRC